MGIAQVKPNQRVPSGTELISKDELIFHGQGRREDFASFQGLAKDKLSLLRGHSVFPPPRELCMVEQERKDGQPP